MVVQAVGTGAAVNTVAPKKLKLLTYLPHHRAEPHAKPTPLSAPFDLGEREHEPLQKAFEAAVDTWQANEKLFWKEDKRKKTKTKLFDLRSVPIALLDLTADETKPRLAGNLMREARYPASIGKIGCMLGAYQLRRDLQVLLADSGARTQKELFALARERWARSQAPAEGSVAEEKFAGVKGKSAKIELLDKLVHLDGKPVPGGAYAAPNLERIFARDDAAMTEFMSTGETFPQLDKFEYPKDFPDLKTKPLSLARLGFQQRLELMIGWSHNGASASCIRDVGFLYINSALLQWGIYDPKAGGGLWVGSSYGGDSFRSDPVARQSIGATPLSLARMFAMLARSRLVDDVACGEMFRLTRKTGFVDWSDAAASRDSDPGRGSYSPFGQELIAHRQAALDKGDPDPYDHLAVHSKLGIYKGDSDVAYIEVQPTGGKKLRFVLAGLKAYTKTPALAVLALAAYEAVRKTN